MEEESRLKYNVKNIPSDFMTDPALCQQLHSKIFELESSNRSQLELDKFYSEICLAIKDEMKTKLPSTKLKPSFNSCNKIRRIRKPWWSKDLTAAWNEICKYEKIWLACKSKRKAMNRNWYNQKANPALNTKAGNK